MLPESSPSSRGPGIATPAGLLPSVIAPHLRSLSSTGITRRLQSYGPLRHPDRPSLPLTGFRLVRATPPTGLPVLLPSPSSMRAAANTPAGPAGALVAHFPASGSLPQRTGGSAPAFQVSRPAQRSLALRPAWSLDHPRRPVTPKATNHSSEHCASWYALWVEAEPETGVDAVTTWLDGLGSDEGSHAAQLFITTLMGERRDAGSGASFEYFQTPRYLKALYVLMHRHIRVAEDIDRAGGGVFSPGLRDDAQEARERLFNLLSEIPGKEAYIALTELIEEHPNTKFQRWMARRARECAEQEGELEAWSPKQVGQFNAKLTRTPETQRQLFDLTVARVTDLKNWLELSNDSPYRTWRKVDDELEFRNLVAGWLNLSWGNPYTVAQEPELANRQRMDIWLQNEKVRSPVPIELKLLDQDWSGPDLCKGLRDQLAGDYLREATGGYGLMVLVWRGRTLGRRWRIDGRLIGIPDLCEALREYWETISNSFPNVAAVEVKLIDLTRRGKASSMVPNE